MSPSAVRTNSPVGSETMPIDVDSRKERLQQGPKRSRENEDDDLTDRALPGHAGTKEVCPGTRNGASLQPAQCHDPSIGHEHITLNARLHAHILEKSNAQDTQAILLLRTGEDFIRAIVHSKNVAREILKQAQQLAPETLLRVRGLFSTLRAGDTNGRCFEVFDYQILTKAKPGLQVSPLRHNAPGEEAKDPSFVPLVLQERLDNRIMDVRVPSSAAVVKLFSAVFELTVEHLAALDFWRIPTPSLIGWEFPGDEHEQFSLAYFGRERAWLSQTGENHLTMAIAADLGRVYDVHTVFRQEDQVSSRHLTEFTSLEMTWAIQRDWTEIMDFSEKLLIFITEALQSRKKYSSLVEQARKLYPNAGRYKLGFDANGHLPRLSFAEGKQILRDVLGYKVDDDVDYTKEEEAALARFLASDESTFGPPSDVFFLTHTPRHIRTYNVYASRDDDVTTHSVEIIMRGQELATGYQSIHDYEELRHAMATRRHPIDAESEAWQPFVKAYEAGIPPLCGLGIGLNRFLQGFLSAASIQETVMFPRDASRLRP